MNLCTFDFIRRLDRQKSIPKSIIDDDETYFMLNKLKSLLNEVLETQTITIQEVADIYSLIFEININLVSNVFPFRAFFDIFENLYPNNIEIIYPLLLIIVHSSFGNYFHPKNIINDIDISILIALLQNFQFKSCSMNLIASICYKDHSYIQMFCEKGLLSALIEIEIDQTFSNFITFLSNNFLTESQLISLSAFVNPLINSKDTQIMINGLDIINNLIKSPIKSLSDNLIDKYHNFLIIKLKEFIESNNEEVIIRILNIFHLIPNLSIEMIDLLFYIINNSILENNDNYLLTCAQIFREQYNFWKNNVNVDLLFDALLPIINGISFKKEASIFLTLMRYGQYQHLSQPLMIKSILRFISYQNFSRMCLNALSKLLSLSASPESLFGDQMQLLFKEISKLANSKDEDVAIESSLLLERVFPQ